MFQWRRGHLTNIIQLLEKTFKVGTLEVGLPEPIRMLYPKSAHLT